jgi:hypothetical protein
MAGHRSINRSPSIVEQCTGRNRCSDAIPRALYEQWSFVRESLFDEQYPANWQRDGRIVSSACYALAAHPKAKVPLLEGLLSRSP